LVIIEPRDSGCVDIFVLPVIILSIWLLLDVLVGIELFK